MYNSLECLDNLKTCKEDDRRYHLQALANSLRELEGEGGDIEALEGEVSDLKDTVESLESTVEDMDDRYISRDWFDLSDYGGITSEEVGALEEEFRHHVHELEDKTEGLQTDLGTLESTVDDLGDTLGGMEETTMYLDNRFAVLVDKVAELADLNAKLTDKVVECFGIVENRLKALESKVSG